ncbi:siderophore-interacting protein [Labedaea rhizosphaerae]|uniref:NADPH-dependent ferric siderophore reductase n=1 Tax=Labedaea rhizosphaerae TaxID=598644 RepID=A0A4R6RWS9_LABRH|nr:siderophore-interacting protein [Labedaea rhizosphaerae]TDP90626.1 NADPH-dependent ferric siderophore reductase [Labedaea rhizosphaerae]
MTERPGRQDRTPTVGQVLRAERVTPHLIRVVLGGPGLAEFTAGPYTDQYVKLLFPLDDAPDQRPSRRTYTVRRWDAGNRELTIDVVEHGDRGLAGPWAARVTPGERIAFLGPGGAYAPDPAVDWHLLAGDESALPAIAATLEQLPASARAQVLIEVSGPDEEQKLDAPGDASITWLHRGDAVVGSALVPAVTQLDFPPGVLQAFVHGEAGFVKELRRHLLVERGIPREQVSISGYWRLGHDEDGWQASKREWNRQVEAEQDFTATIRGSHPA